jgi:MinD-like ATPase involved in chromosome partitioning or flagellar assembly
MNTDFTFSNLSSMFASETSYNTLVDMIKDMDLELMDISIS